MNRLSKEKQKMIIASLMEAGVTDHVGGIEEVLELF